MSEFVVIGAFNFCIFESSVHEREMFMFRYEKKGTIKMIDEQVFQSSLNI